jgi:hypothetical protein
MLSMCYSDRSYFVKGAISDNSDLICLLHICHTPICFVSDANLEVKSTNPLVNDVKHGLVEDGSGSDKGDDSNHSETSVDDLGFLSESGLEGGQVSERLRIALGHLLVIGVVGVQKERVSKRKRADGGHQRDSEEVGISDEDDGTLVADGLLSRDGGKSSPLLQVEESAGIRDESVPLGVSRGADEDPSKHGVAAVPLLGLDGRSPSPLGKRGELSLPVLLGGIINRRVDDLQRAGLLDDRRLARSEGAGNADAEQKGEKGLERRHLSWWCPSVNSFKFQPCDHTPPGTQRL